MAFLQGVQEMGLSGTMPPAPLQLRVLSKAVL